MSWAPPAGEAVDWAQYCGAPIPVRTTVNTTLPAGSSLTTINNAIAACPSGQVVVLAAGTTNLSGTIRVNKDGVTFRGEGMGQTIINSSANPAITSDDYSWFGDKTGRTISSGATQGSTMITVASGASDFHTGELLQIDGLDLIGMVFSTNGPGRHVRFTFICTGVSGNNISFTPPLPVDLSALTPLAYGENYPPSGAESGIESMTVNSTTGADTVIENWNTYRFFIYDVEVTGAGNAFIQLNDSFQPTVKKCKIHGVENFPANTDGYGCYPYYHTSWWLVEDCIFYDLWSGMFVTGASPGAALYNFATNCNAVSLDRQLPGLNSNHGPCPMFVLWEGNAINQWQNDGYHGNATYQYLFRNYISGIQALRMKNVKLVDATRGSYKHFVIGNVLGSAEMAALTGLAYTMTGEPDYDEMPVIYRLGYPNQGNNDLEETVDNAWKPFYTIDYADVQVAATAILHANWDCFNDSIINVPGQDTVMPSSLFYSSKPDWFFGLPWPPYSASSPDDAEIANIPAGYRYLNNDDDPPVGGDSNIGTLTVANLIIG